MPFSRELTKAEQADLGKLKKSVAIKTQTKYLNRQGALLPY